MSALSRSPEPRAPSAAAVPPPIRSDPNPGALRALLHLFYDVLWLLAIVLGSPWWLWRCALGPEFRRMAAGRATLGLPPPPRPGERARILLHGVSVGEVRATQPLVRALEAEHPELEIVLSATTLTGIAEARRLYPGKQVLRFPLDPSPLVRRFLARLRPVAVVLIELEIWPNFLRGANRMGIPIAVVNGRITERSFANYRLFKHLLPQFNRISLFCVQDEEYARRFRALAGDGSRLVVTGNMKADALKVGRVEPGAELRRLLGGAPGQPVIVGGSTHAPEELLLAQAWRAAVPGARLVLVPRHPVRAPQLVRELAQAGFEVQLLGELRAGRARPDPRLPVLVDTIGELERVYGLATLAFVGGSLAPHGGQNVLEPAAQGLPVIHGPHVRNFALEAELLFAAGASRRIESSSELGPALAALLDDPAARERMGAAGSGAVAAQQGATALTLAALRERCLAGS